jgi:sulfate adenylyltransferase subunit 2
MPAVSDPAPNLAAMNTLPPALRRLESDSIEILREAFVGARKPVLLYSAGKDSSVLLHLACKAFHPAPPPFPLLHIDTGWKFRELLAHRDRAAAAAGMELLVFTNHEGMAAGVSPLTHGSAFYTDVMKTQALRQALQAHQFDTVIGGARRDEEHARAKERIFSVRGPGQRWDPKTQRAEFWDLYNTHLRADDSMRVFPLSNWTELAVWRYIAIENIAVVPLYFARVRPVLERDDALLVLDDGRLQAADGETVRMRCVRFRTLGCYPLTGAVESGAGTAWAVLAETAQSSWSERQGRLIDRDTAGSMEMKKQQGYF